MVCMSFVIGWSSAIVCVLVHAMAENGIDFIEDVKVTKLLKVNIASVWRQRHFLSKAATFCFFTQPMNDNVNCSEKSQK